MIGPTIAEATTNYSRFDPGFRAYFDDRYPGLAGTEYHIYVEPQVEPWLAATVPGAEMVRVFAKTGMLPGTFILWQDRAYLAPEEFNTFLADARIRATNSNQAIGIAGIYAQAWEPDGKRGSPGAIILQSAQDIPHGVNPVNNTLSSLVASSRVTMGGSSFNVTLYSWAPKGGFLRKWDITVSPGGTVRGAGTLLGIYIGDCEPEYAVYIRPLAPVKYTASEDKGVIAAGAESSRSVVIDGVTRFIIHWRPDDWNPGVSDADPDTIVGWVEAGARAGYQKIINDAHFQINPLNPTVDIYIWNESPGGEYGPGLSYLHPPSSFGNFYLPFSPSPDGKYYIYVTDRIARDYVTVGDIKINFPTFPDFYTGTVSHEFFHIIELGYNMTDEDADWMMEGQARFIPTYVIGGDQGEFWQNQNLIYLPPGPYFQSADHRSKIIYNSMSYLDTTNLNYLDYFPPEDRWRHIGYDACLYWRYVFEHFGGISTIRQIDEQYQSALPGDSLCQQIAVVNSVLGTSDMGFANFAEANYLEFSPHAFARHNNYYQFSDRYYGNVHLNDTIDWASGTATYSRSGTLSGFGVEYFEIIPHGNVNSMKISFSGDPGPYVVKTFSASGTNVVTTPIPLNTDNNGFVTLSGIGSADVIGLMIAKPTCTSGGSYSWNARNLEIPLPSTTTLTSSANPSKWGQPVTFNATVTDGATGEVIFLIGARPPVSGSLNQHSPNNATYGPLSDLNIGDTNIDAQYMGDTANQPSSAPRLIQTVVKADTTIIVTSNHNPSVFGQTVTFTATVSVVSPGTGTLAGTVQFKVDGANRGAAVPLSSGSASIDISDLGVTTGTNHVIQAIYSGNANYLTSTGTLSGGQKVNKANTATTVISSKNPSVYSQLAPTFIATVSAVAPGVGTPSGTVTFKDGTITLGTGTLSGGSATLTPSTTALAVGTHSITAVYGGAANFIGSTSPVLTQTVNPPPKITAYVPNNGKRGAAAFKFVISGSAFQNGATVSLTKTGIPTIDATGVTVSSTKNSITCMLPIPSSAPIGTRSVLVKNPDGGTSTVSGFTVK